MKIFILLFVCLNLGKGNASNVTTTPFKFTCTSESEAMKIGQRNFGSSKWPNAIVKYELHSSLTSADITEFYKAIDVYHKKTCVRFQQRNGEADYVSIENDPTTCGLAGICKWGGYQYARFGGSCRNAAVMVHELGHTLCFGHEQSRVDRDNYLSFPCNNPPGINTGYDTLGLLYDYKSSMHYGCDSCMVPKMGDVSTSMCGGDYLSVLDVEKINAFYDCSGCLGYRFRPLSKMTAAEKADLLPAGSDIDGTPLYVCRVYQSGDIIPGKGNINTGQCWVGWGQQEHGYTSGSEFLTKGKSGTSLTWVQKPSNNVIPANAIAGGRTREGETLYIARVYVSIDGKTTRAIGKVHATKPDRIFIPFNGLEYTVLSFEFLQC